MRYNGATLLESAQIFQLQLVQSTQTCRPRTIARESTRLAIEISYERTASLNSLRPIRSISATNSIWNVAISESDGLLSRPKVNPEL